MPDIVLLRLEGPLMSFGGVKIDARSPTETFPSASMISGLIANSLGFDHREMDRVQRIQDRLIIASRQDLPGKIMTDYQTVNLGKPAMAIAWTTRGEAETHGGSVNDGTHQRWVQYIQNAVYTVAFTMTRKIEPDDPRIDQIVQALQTPARPLFLGRKSCVPSSPVLFGVSKKENVLEALIHVPFSPRSKAEDSLFAQWPALLGGSIASRNIRVHDKKDWMNGIHVGRSDVRQGMIKVNPDLKEVHWTSRKDLERFRFQESA